MARWWYGLRRDNGAQPTSTWIHYYRKFQLEIWYAIKFSIIKKKTFERNSEFCDARV